MSRFSVKVAGAATALAITLLAGCQAAKTTQSGAVGVDRTQYFAVSQKQVEQSSAQAYQKIMTEESRKGNVNTDPEEVRRVRGVASRLIPVTAAFRQDAPGWRWEVNVLRSDQLNAWCMAGGKIAVYSALMEKLRLTDDELAAVMGHEIAHALREHSRERMSQQLGTQMLVTGIAVAAGFGQLGADLTNMAADLAISKPNSRSHETEADRIGIELAARAGYNPQAAISLWQKMESVGGSSGPQFLSTHPSPENRMRDLADYAQRVQPLYEQAKRGRG